MLLHPYCSLFPPIDADELQELANGIKKNGFRKGKEIITFGGKILEGQNRFNACELVRVKPVFKAFKGTEKEALEFVIDENLRRRHLNQSQRAMIAAEIAKCQNSDTSVSAVSKSMKVSRDTIHKAARIKKEKPALAKKIAAGKISINAATKKLAPLPDRVRPKMDFADVYTSSPAKAAPAETRSLGQIAYEKYAGMMAEVLGAPSWSHEGEKSQKAWEAAAQEVLKTKK